MARVILHKSKVTTRIIGGGEVTRTGTLCNRLSNAGEDMNVADGDGEVTCKFCLRTMDAMARAKANPAA